MDTELRSLLALLRRPQTDVRLAVRVGSRVYQTAGPQSDVDYLVVLNAPDHKADLLFGPNINVTLHGTRSFEKALNEGSVYAFEALFAPAPHRLVFTPQPFSYKFNPPNIVASAVARSKSDFEKAKKTYPDEPNAARKKLFHSLRILLFARELVETAKLTRFDAAKDVFEEIMSHPATTFEPLGAEFGALRDKWVDELLSVGKK
ncbi:MAG: nucleotidyltransferase domain-containing protein [Polyangiaceae bacterium]|nr:nucleotidyltransferase domain-containing protein [Polyangiaceae bacterium]